MKRYEIIDDCVPSPVQDEIENQLFEHMPLYYLKGTIREYDTSLNPWLVYSKAEQCVDEPFFFHMLYRDGEVSSDWFNMVTPIAEALLKPEANWRKNIIRIKANLQMKNGCVKEGSYNAPHKDTKGTHTVLLYYINDNDTDTIFWEELGDGNIKEHARVKAKKGRCVVFDGDWLHASAIPRISEKAVVNIVISKSINEIIK